jgi:hypothetical protein
VDEDGLGTDAEEQREKKQQLEYEEAMKLLELLRGLSHETSHWFYQICWLFFDFDCSLPGHSLGFGSGADQVAPV